METARPISATSIKSDGASASTSTDNGRVAAMHAKVPPDPSKEAPRTALQPSPTVLLAIAVALLLLAAALLLAALFAGSLVPSAAPQALTSAIVCLTVGKVHELIDLAALPPGTLTGGNPAAAMRGAVDVLRAVQALWGHLVRARP
jgi:hypothetical protein